jgi:hypothetical protein
VRDVKESSEGLELKVRVDYQRNGVDLATLSDIMEQGLIQAVGEGLFTGDSEAEVDTWSLEIRRVKSPFAWFERAIKREIARRWKSLERAKRGA